MLSYNDKLLLNAFSTFSLKYLHHIKTVLITEHASLITQSLSMAHLLNEKDINYYQTQFEKMIAENDMLLNLINTIEKDITTFCSNSSSTIPYFNQKYAIKYFEKHLTTINLLNYDFENTPLS